MNVRITTFKNPFSFFCIAEEDCKNPSVDLIENPVEPANVCKSKINLSDATHGQYVAVIWKNKWTRGLISMESQFLIWLIDYGIYLRPNDNTIYVNLPAEFKKLPSKVFEASIHGVVPVDKTLTEECEIKNKIADVWNAGSIEKAQSLIDNAIGLCFIPIALFSTKENDVVIGDLYLEVKENVFINIIDKLQMWPVFLEKNPASYFENITIFYTSRRKHRACQLKPAFVDSALPTFNFETSFSEYCAICDSAPHYETFEECDTVSEDGSTVLEYDGMCAKSKSLNKLSAADIEKYANMFITVCGREYNVLNVLINKTKDLNICEMYKDHDLKSFGRACYRRGNKGEQNCLMHD